MVLFWFTGSAVAGFVDDKKNHESTSVQSLSVSAGNSYVVRSELIASTVDPSKYHIGLDYNWDYSYQRWDYSYDFHLYNTHIRQDERSTLSFQQQSSQHNLGFMITDRVKVFGFHRFEEVEQANRKSYHQRYQPGLGLGWSVVRKPMVQFDILLGSVADVAITNGFESSGVVVPRNLAGTSGYWLGEGQSLAVNWYSFIMSSVTDPTDYLVETNVDFDVHLVYNLYFRTTLHHSYEEEPIDALPSDTRVTAGITWSPRKNRCR